MTTAFFRADLHCHSFHSDGQHSPVQLLDLAKREGLQGLSITDHDAISAYSADTFMQAEQRKVRLIPGIELSTLFNRHRLHLLGYSFAVTSSLLSLLGKQRAARKTRNEEMLKRLQASRMPIPLEMLQMQFPGGEELSFEKVLSFTGRLHIAKAMQNAGYVSSLRNAFYFIGDRGKCFIEGEYCRTQEAIDILHKSGGFAVVAHPHLIKDRILISHLLSLPFDGIEVFYRGLDERACQPWKRRAEKGGLMMTGGSDFHGCRDVDLRLGASFISEDVFNILEARFHANQEYNVVKGEKE